MKPTQSAASNRPSTNVVKLADLQMAFGRKKIVAPARPQLRDKTHDAEDLQDELDAEATNRGGIADTLKRLFENYCEFLACKDEVAAKLVFRKNGAENDGLHAYLDEVLNVEEPLRSVAAVNHLKTVMSMAVNCTCHQHAEFLVNNLLVEHGLLIDDNRGDTIKLNHRTYQFGEGFEFDRKDIREIEQAAQQYYEVIGGKEREWDRAKKEEMAVQSNVSLVEALTDKKKMGLCLVHTPAKVFDTTAKRSKPGEILFNFQGQFVIPLSATGKLQSHITDIINRGADKLLTRELAMSAKEPDFRELAREVGRRYDIDLKDDWPAAQDCARDARTLWRAIRRGYDHMLDMEKQAADNTVMAKKAKTTTAKFFGVDGKAPVEGKVAYISYDGVLDMEKQGRDDLYNPGVLAKRTTDNEQVFVELVEVPPHLEDYLGKYVGQKCSINDRKAYPELCEFVGRIGAQIKKAAKPAANETAEKTATA